MLTEFLAGAISTFTGDDIFDLFDLFDLFDPLSSRVFSRGYALRIV